MIEPALEDKFKSIVSAAHEYLKPRGYSKSGAKFRRGLHNNYVIVQFQKSAWNSADSIKFTVNFSVVSSRLAAESGQDAAKIFSEFHGHARARIGNFQSEPSDIWWTLDRDISPSALIAALLPLLESGTEYFEANASDRALAALWQKKKGSGGTEDEPMWLVLAVKSLIES